MSRPTPSTLAARARSSLRTSSLLAALAVLAVAPQFACAKPHLAEPPAPATLRPKFLSILTEGVMIEGQEENWEIVAGDPVEPPFASEWPGGKPVAATGDLLEKHGAFVEGGARRCRVKVPGRAKPLYGVLALLPVFESSSSSSARRTFRISIPAERIEQALGGQVSVVFEPYPYTFRYIAKNPADEEYYAETTAEAPSWVLWISDAPFAGGRSKKSKAEVREEQRAAAAEEEKANKERADKEQAEKDARASREKADKERAEKERSEREAAAAAAAAADAKGKKGKKK